MKKIIILSSLLTISFGSIFSMEYDKEKRAEALSSALFDAITQNSESKLKDALEAGADPNGYRRNPVGWECSLNMAMRYDLYNNKKSKEIPLTTLLVQYGAKLNEALDKDYTFGNHTPLESLLYGKMLDWFSRENEWEMRLGVMENVILASEKYQKIIMLLLKSGATLQTVSRGQVESSLRLPEGIKRVVSLILFSRE